MGVLVTINKCLTNHTACYRSLWLCKVPESSRCYPCETQTQRTRFNTSLGSPVIPIRTIEHKGINDHFQHCADLQELICQCILFSNVGENLERTLTNTLTKTKFCKFAVHIKKTLAVNE